MYRNRAEDRRAEVMSTANGVGIGFGGDQAYQQWLRSEQASPQQGDPAVLRQKATIMRLQSLYGSQKNPGLVGVIKRRIH